MLLSQGIESVIEPDEGKQFALLISADRYPAALELIAQYRLENRHWPWQQKLFQARVVFDWACLAWVFVLAFFFCLGLVRDLEGVGILDSVAVARGQWWRLVTGICLHADIAHLVGNAVLGALLLGLTMGCFGTGLGLLLSMAAGVGGNLLSLLAANGVHHLSLGASGMVMGSLGLLATSNFFAGIRPWRPRRLLGGLFAGIFIFMLVGLSPGTNILAHAGGFICGVFLGIACRPLVRICHYFWANLATALMFIALVFVPWWFAWNSRL